MFQSLKCMNMAKRKPHLPGSAARFKDLKDVWPTVNFSFSNSSLYQIRYLRSQHQIRTNYTNTTPITVLINRYPDGSGTLELSSFTTM